MSTTRKDKREARKGYNAFADSIKIIRHYFPNFIKLIRSLSDPRHQSYIKYSPEHLILTRVFSYFCHLESLIDMNKSFNEDCVINNFKILFGEEYDEIPHGDTINNYFRNLSVRQLRGVLYALVNDLIEKKLFDDYKISGRYYQVLIDGVNLYTFHKKHIDGSIVRKHSDDRITYHTDMLVAVISMGNIIIPLDFEPIENIGISYDKQDCEINAAKRMLRRIKSHFKRLPLCISGDALYFSEPMIKEVEGYRWKYIFTFKEGCSKETSEYYRTAQNHGDTQKHEEVIDNVQYEYEYYNGVEYRDNCFNMISLVQKDSEGRIVNRFCYATNIEISQKNYRNIVKFARRRWKIENKGFNDLKNHGYQMGHVFSYDENAVKVHLIIMLMSHMMMQLLEHYEKTKKRFEGIRYLGREIKEALRKNILSTSDLMEIATPFYISRLIPY